MDTVVVMNESDSDLVKAIFAKQERESKGLTRKEIQKLMGWGESKTLNWLNSLIDLGFMDTDFEYRQYNNKLWNKKTVYYLTDKGRKYAVFTECS